MKVLAINGSPHREGTTYYALSLVAEELAKGGIETEIFHIGEGPIQSCIGCNRCLVGNARRCVFNNDGVAACRSIADTCDGLLLGAPTYYGGIAGGMKSFLDRLFYSGTNFRGKAAAAITVARRSGGEDAFQQLCNYLHLGGTCIVPTIYWNYIHGNNAEEAAKDLEGVQIMRGIGSNMAWLMKCLATSRESLIAPEMEPRVLTNFIRMY